MWLLLMRKGPMFAVRVGYHTIDAAHVPRVHNPNTHAGDMDDRQKAARPKPCRAGQRSFGLLMDSRRLWAQSEEVAIHDRGVV